MYKDDGKGKENHYKYNKKNTSYNNTDTENTNHHNNKEYNNRNKYNKELNDIMKKWNNMFVSKQDKEIYNSWRCDIHPAWSKSYQWIVINYCIYDIKTQSIKKSVLIGYLGNNNLTNFFS